MHTGASSTKGHYYFVGKKSESDRTLNLISFGLCYRLVMWQQCEGGLGLKATKNNPANSASLVRQVDGMPLGALLTASKQSEKRFGPNRFPPISISLDPAFSFLHPLLLSFEQITRTNGTILTIRRSAKST